MYIYVYIYIHIYMYIYIYIQTGSLKTVGQNGVPSRNPVFCMVSGQVFFENLRVSQPSETIFLLFERNAVEEGLQGSFLFSRSSSRFFVRCWSLETQMIFFGG